MKTTASEPGVVFFPAGDWFGKHSVWISKRVLGGTPDPLGSRLQLNSERSEITE